MLHSSVATGRSVFNVVWNSASVDMVDFRLKYNGQSPFSLAPESENSFFLTLNVM